MDVDVAAPERIDVLKAIAEPARWRIIERLAEEDQCVCHLVADLDMAQPLVSHHLKVLRDVGLVESERYRHWTYYHLRAGALVELGRTIGALVTRSARTGGRRRPCS
jgi:ArsR family transcriptional regulator